jgi:hypothetical protein
MTTAGNSSPRKAVFRKLCGSYQYELAHPEDLRTVMQNDDAFWALLSAPVTALSGDPLFYRHLDSTASNSIRVDKIKDAFYWLDSVLKDLSSLAGEAPAITLDELRDDTANGREIISTITNQLTDELINDGVITLTEVRDAIGRLSAGNLKGDGIIVRAAVAGSVAEQLFTDILTVLDGADNPAGLKGITLPLLDKFLSDAQAYLHWAENDTYATLLPGVDMPPMYACYRQVAPKVDQYFDYCKLVQIDPANAKRFVEKADALSPLDVRNQSAVHEAIEQAPLASPDPSCVLDVTQDLNPAYRDSVRKLAEVFELEKISLQDWDSIKAKFAGYEGYLKGKDGNSAEKLGTDRLKEDTANTEAIDFLRGLFQQDSSIMNNIKRLHYIEKLLLYKQYYFRFVRSFISLFELFNPTRLSMLQAGSLIMDGKHFDLCLKITDPAAHKQLARTSNLFILYMHAKRTINGVASSQKIAAAVTAGTDMAFYPGKAGLFVDWDGSLWDIVIEDILQGPICFKQSLALPFVKISNIITTRFSKLTSAEIIANDLTNKIEKAGTAPPPPAAAKPGMNGSMWLLAGGVGFAAVFSGLTYIFKQLASMPILNLLFYLLLIFMCIMTPLVIYSLYKLYKRNFSMFFEAAGWAVNLRMKLDTFAGRFFSYLPAYPENFVKKGLDTTSIKVKKNSRDNKREWFFPVVLLTLLVLAFGLLTYYLHFRTTEEPVKAPDSSVPVQTKEVSK